jgi:DtxR family transcriptional regulator, Mn-dependent transcriptional regulator
VGHAHAHTVDEYLETVYFLAFPIGEYGPVVRDSPALAARVAEMLGVSAPTVSEMLKRMEADGLIERGSRKEAILTEQGRHEAERVVRRHRLIEVFLTEFMGYTPAEAHVHADALGAAFTDDMIERMTEQLGHPDRCPHGWPVDTAVEQAENRELRPLSEIGAGSSATIVRLAEHDGELLSWFYDEGLTPGTEVRVESHDPAATELDIALAGAIRSISTKAAEGLFVLPA